MRSHDPLTDGLRRRTFVRPAVLACGQAPFRGELRDGLRAGRTGVEMSQERRLIGLVNLLVEQILPGVTIGTSMEGASRLDHGAGSTSAAPSAGSESSRAMTSRIIRCTFFRAT